ncbi:phosphate ABC transporter membrane protein 1, PhoT family (TC 3.A.1.7.1) [Armatimonadetes bacterium GBS]|jgi:phosphate transport system permease protein|nr:phosphate ABC transporter membrane protein 1, PhoT family (TC 3.A.1.7.1) [Armatimonadetes bacterium GBS]CUU34447.1 phosphate ABC transporter membrane protein 1, PhoT family (TC 3.A.1.7.1) [Armatimonadetes bacterium GXS]
MALKSANSTEVAQAVVRMPTASARKRVRWEERIVRVFLFLCAALSVLTTAAIVFILFSQSLGFFRKASVVEFLTGTEWAPLFNPPAYGVLPLVTGTLLTSLIAMLVAGPMGLLVAVYLSEYASPRLRRVVKPALEVLAGIPTVVYGYFALTFVTPLLQKFIPGLEGFNALSAGLVMGIMILPTVASLSEDALYAVPNSLRYGSLALGATRFQTTWGVVVPAAMSGISASFILGVARAVGETMIVAIAAGQQANFTFNPLRAVETMTTYIVRIAMGDVPYGSPEYYSLFAVGLLLFLITLALNLISEAVRRRYKGARA